MVSSSHFKSSAVDMNHNHHTTSPNIIIFGQTGVGKSSLINMMAGAEVAGVSNRAAGQTQSNRGYPLRCPQHLKVQTFDDTYKFWDTPGLNEGEEGNVPPRAALDMLFNLVKDNRVNLVFYCIRPRLTNIVRVNYDLFWSIICGRKVPIVLVVTGLELEQNLDDWWTNNVKAIEQMGMTFDDHACVTTTKGANGIYTEEFQESEAKLWGMVQRHCSQNPWTMPREWHTEVPMRMDTYMARYNKRTIGWWWALLRGILFKRSPRRSRQPSRKSSTTSTHNVIVFGEKGSGKSSVVNMLVGKEVAHVSNTLSGCTFESQCYNAHVGNTDICIYDTAGLNKADNSQAPHWKAIQQLYTLIRQLDSVSLLIYCLRGRIEKTTLHANWTLFNKVICSENVPIIILVTGTERNKKDGADSGMKEVFQELEPKDVAYIVSSRGRQDEFKELYEQSQSRVEQLVEQSLRREPWSIEKDKWFASIYREVYSARLCFPDRTELEFVDEMRKIIDKFVQETTMSEAESNKLRATLLDAERTIWKEQRKNNEMRRTL